MAVSFETDIRPLFRDSPDVDAMKEYGLDLSSYEEVKAQAEEICGRLEDGSMPCDEPWLARRAPCPVQTLDGGRHGPVRLPAGTTGKGSRLLSPCDSR